MQETSRPITLVGFVGGSLDACTDLDRFTKWRPTLALVRHFQPARLHLLTVSVFAAVAEYTAADVRQICPGIEVTIHYLDDPKWDFEGWFALLYDFARALPLDPAREDVLVNFTTGNFVMQICMFLLTEAHLLPGRLVMAIEPHRSGPPITVVDLNLGRYDRVAQRFAAAVLEGLTLLKGGVDTRNAAYNAQMEDLERVAESSAPILLLGPTGAGKSALAVRIHKLKLERRRVTGPLVVLNCAGLRGELARSELFGHVKGAFTGALSDRAGALRRAHGGVLFLDEIGELGPDEQGLLLRALDTGRYLPVGADREEHSDFQLICGTNRDLYAEVAAGRFREDLLARIDPWTFELPSLRERPEDFEPNLDRLLADWSKQMARRVHFNAEARAAYLEFAFSPEAEWRGNFRDLIASVERLATLADGGRITVADVQKEIPRLRGAWARLSGKAAPAPGATPAPAPAASWPPPTDRADALLGERASAFDHFERAMLHVVLGACAVSKDLSAAGRMLFDVSRLRKTRPNDTQRLSDLFDRFGIDWRTLWPKKKEKVKS
jgi:transcriptional regulatory protein RtcR